MLLIHDVASKLGVTANALRYYEKVGVIDPVSRDKNGIRHYNDQDIERAKMALILRGMGMPVKDVKDALHELPQAPTLDELYKFRAHMQDLADQLNIKAQKVQREIQLVQNKIKLVNMNISNWHEDFQIPEYVEPNHK
ncbi:MerR family transcriptional regulator [Lentilactobacillus otakiensis]|uniref:MerR family transcriptional regulator n=1 Tax=Lentilactobacillus otakiensis TaxID=481720 RepID=UPI003D1741D6